MHGIDGVSLIIDEREALICPFKKAAVEVVDVCESHFAKALADEIAAIADRAVGDDEGVAGEVFPEGGIKGFETGKLCTGDVGLTEFFGGSGIEDHGLMSELGELGDANKGNFEGQQVTQLPVEARGNKRRASVRWCLAGRAGNAHDAQYSGQTGSAAAQCNEAVQVRSEWAEYIHRG